MLHDHADDHVDDHVPDASRSSGAGGASSRLARERRLLMETRRIVDGDRSEESWDAPPETEAARASKLRQIDGQLQIIDEAFLRIETSGAGDHPGRDRRV